jgi:hypothetical protein
MGIGRAIAYDPRKRRAVMRWVMRCLVAVLAVANLGAAAQDRVGPNLGAGVAVPGGVSQIDMAQRLYALALVHRDAVLAVAAARLVTGVQISGVGIGPDLGAMLTQARSFAGEDEGLLGVIEGVAAAGAWGQISGAKRQGGAVDAGAQTVWTMPFFGEATAEVGLWGDGAAPLAVVIADENGNVVPCPAQVGPVRAEAAFYCAFVPMWNGNFTVTVANAGTATAEYALITN